jgi:hypothetical protein
VVSDSRSDSRSRGRRCQSASGSANLQSTICNLESVLMGGGVKSAGGLAADGPRLALDLGLRQG